MDIMLDDDWYLRRNPDVARDVERGRFASAAEHYEKFGFLEGRAARPCGPKFIIHIGPHKTGTTYLQSCMVKSELFLKENGCLYPSVWLDPDGLSHRHLVTLLEQGKIGEIEQSIALMAQNYSTIIVSSEDLCLIGLRSIDILGYMLEQFDVQIVFAVRPWPNRIGSIWKQSLFDGATETFPRFVARHLANPLMSYAMNDIAAVEGWCNVFGRSKVSLFSYPDLDINNLDMFKFFLEKFTDISTMPQFHAEDRVHSSGDSIASEMARCLNSLSSITNIKRRQGYYFLSHGGLYNSYPLRDVLTRYVSYIHLDDCADIWDHMHHNLLARYSDLIIGPYDQLKIRSSVRQAYVTADHLLDPQSRDALYHLWNDINLQISLDLNCEVEKKQFFNEFRQIDKRDSGQKSWWRKLTKI